MRTWLLAALAASMLAGTALAQTQSYLVTINPARRESGFEKVRISKAALAGAEVRLWANAAIDPDCKAHEPGATLTIVRPPTHGTLRISDEPAYLSFPQGNPRAVCNDRKVPGHQAFYLAESGYKGRDRAVLQGSSPDGRVREIIVDIEVR